MQLGIINRLTTLELANARILQRWCTPSDVICCDSSPPVPGLQCAGFPPLPNQLFLTLSGFQPPYTCTFAPGEVDGVDYALWNCSQADIGNRWGKFLDAGDPTQATPPSTWTNGSYRLNRVTADTYILADSTSPVVPGTSQNTGQAAIPSGGCWGFSTVCRQGNNYNVFDGPGCAAEPFDLATVIANYGQPMLSPGVCQYAPNCDFDVISACPTGFAPNIISFSPAAVGRWVSYWNSFLPFPPFAGYPPCSIVGLGNLLKTGAIDTVCPFTFNAGDNGIKRADFGVSIKTYKQIYLQMGCRVPTPPAPFYSVLPVTLRLFTYIVTTRSYKITNSCDPLDQTTYVKVPTIWAFENWFGVVPFPDPNLWDNFTFPSAGNYYASQPRFNSIGQHIGNFELST